MFICLFRPASQPGSLARSGALTRTLACRRAPWALWRPARERVGGRRATGARRDGGGGGHCARNIK